MNERQKAFADYYIETLNATESYKRAYPSCKKDTTAKANGSRLLTYADVEAYIQERLASKEAARIASQDEVLEFLTAVMRGDIPDQLGLETPVKERNRAAELLAKRYGLFVEKHEHTGKDGGPIQTQNLTNEELDAKIARLLKEVKPDEPG